MLLGIQIIPRINRPLQSQPHAIIIWQHLLVALHRSNCHLLHYQHNSEESGHHKTDSKLEPAIDSAVDSVVDSAVDGGRLSPQTHTQHIMDSNLQWRHLFIRVEVRNTVNGIP